MYRDTHASRPAHTPLNGYPTWWLFALAVAAMLMYMTLSSSTSMLVAPHTLFLDGSNTAARVGALDSGAARTEVEWRRIIATAVGIDESELLIVSIAPTNGDVYAASARTLYSLRDGVWQSVGRTPESPTAFAVADARVMFAGSLANGLYRSINGGQSWQQMSVGLPNANRLTVSALAVDPVNTQRVYVALAGGIGEQSSSSTVAPMDAIVLPLGIYASRNGGDHWSLLASAPRDALTRRLSLDAAAPQYLLGTTDTGVWRTRIAISDEESSQ